MNTIGWAVKNMQNSHRVRRAGWNGKGMSLYYVTAYQVVAGAMMLPFVVMITAQGDHVPWLCSQTDLLATDWELAE